MDKRMNEPCMPIVRTTRIAVIAFVSVTSVVMFSACTSEGKVGESCDESGKTDGQCESGGVCGKNSAGSLLCLKVCTDQAQCSTTEDCNGVEGSSMKGCRPKDTKK